MVLIIIMLLLAVLVLGKTVKNLAKLTPWLIGALILMWLAKYWVIIVFIAILAAGGYLFIKKKNTMN